MIFVFNKIAHLLSICILASVVSGCGGQPTGGGGQTVRSSEILILTKTEGFRHNSISAAANAMREFDEGNQDLSVTITEDASSVSPQNLQNFGAVMFLNTTGDVLNESQQAALKNFIQGGGGFMGVHSATDTEYNWPWYGRMIGAYFSSHPEVQEADLFVLNNSHPATQYLPGVWTRTDEWYNFRDIQDHIIPLINLDESSYEGGENGQNHPIAWYHEFEGGRVFYTAGGHTSESYRDQQFQRHLLGGLKYVLGIQDN